MTTDQRAIVELLFRVSREVATALELQAVLQRLLFAAINNVGGERASIVVLNDELKPVESAIVYGKNVYEQTTQQLRDTVERGLAGWVVTNRKGAVVPDTSKDERWLQREDDARHRSGAKSAICVPLIAREKLVGTLTLVHSTPDTFNDDHLALMQAIADQAGVAVLNARLYHESQRQARVMGALVESAATINASLRLDEVFQTVLKQTQTALQVEVAAIALLDTASNDLVYRAAVGQNTERLIGRRLQYGQGTVADVVRTGQGVVVSVPRQTAPFREGGEEIIVRAFAAAPISASGQPLGVILGVNPIAKHFDPDVLHLLAGLGNLAGTALQNASLFEKLDAAQKRYRELFEDNIDPLIITDPAGCVVEINLRVIDMSGFMPDDLRGQSLETLIDIKPGLNLLSAVSLLKTRTYEAELRKKDGTNMPVEVHVRRVLFDNTESLQWILRDITERKELDALRNDMTAMIYHDLRSPLANIVSALDVLEGMFSPAELETNASLVGIARFNIDRIRRLIDSLLDINKLEAGEAIANRAPFALNLLTDDLVKATQPRAEARHQILTVTLANDLPLVAIDRDMIRRVLINLIENAIKYTPENGQIEVGAQVQDDFVRVWVQDDGPGIPANERERIFDKFARLKGHRTIQGLGIGLAFCRLAVTGHGGKIWVEPAPVQGSRFIFTLPISKE